MQGRVPRRGGRQQDPGGYLGGLEVRVRRRRFGLDPQGVTLCASGRLVKEKDDVDASRLRVRSLLDGTQRVKAPPGGVDHQPDHARGFVQPRFGGMLARQHRSAIEILPRETPPKPSG